MPSPPAWLTAAASFPPAAEPIGASRIGCWSPSRRVRAVSMVAIVVSRSDAETVEPRCRPVEQVGLLGSARPVRQPLAGVPEHAVAVGDLVDAEVAFEHRPAWPEGRDAGLSIRSSERRELFRAGRQLAYMHVETEHPHTEAAQLHVHGGARLELSDALAPVGEHRVP